MPSDNEVWVTTDPASQTDFQILTGHFVVTDFDVTSGEATTITIGSDTWFNTPDRSGFHFGADRSGSGEVATWFNNKSAPASQNTFDHDAGELNFAVQGTMSLWVSGSTFTDNQQLTFENVFFAQGHSGTSNNWWFAVAGATGSGDDEIKVKDQSGNYQLRFLRGGPGNPVDTVYVYV